jgi:hypothetical protein
MLTDVVIYTKDRACQLDLLLRSIKYNFINVNKVWVLLDWSNDDFKAGYDRIKNINYNLNIVFKAQTRDIFYSVLKQIVGESITGSILPLCDDDVFIRQTDIIDVSSYVDDNTVGIHFRFSSDLTISYHSGKILPLPKFITAGNYLKWDWTTYKNVTRWGYPYQAGGVVYKTEFFNYMLNNIKFDLPNSLESAMMCNRYVWKKKFIIAFKHSPIVNISINRIQSDVNNRGGRDINYSPFELNYIFLSGNIIDTTKIYNVINNCEFIEIPLNFVRDTR